MIACTLFPHPLADLPMFQPAVKLAFVKLYCPPPSGWTVKVDIDASEEGRTGGKRINPSSIERQAEMQAEAARARAGLKELGVNIGKRANWFAPEGLPPVGRTHDIVAFNSEARICIVAEVEGQSIRQPEQKVYSAIGQLVRAARNDVPENWTRFLVAVVNGCEMTRHLRKLRAAERLGISGYSITDDGEGQRLFGGKIPQT